MTGLSVNAVGWREGLQSGNVVGQNYTGGSRIVFDQRMELQDQLLTVFIFGNNPVTGPWQCTGTLYDIDKVLTSGRCIWGSSSRRPGVATNPGQSISVQFYTPQAVSNSVSVFKFAQDRVFQTKSMHIDILSVLRAISNNTPIDYVNFAPPEYYETIKVIRVLPVNGDAVVLKLASMPKIVLEGAVIPLSQIRIASYRTVAEEEALDGREAELGFSDKPEVMGFGLPNFERFRGNISLPGLYHPEKLFLNLRSVSRGAQLQRSGFHCPSLVDNCFQYAFTGMTATDPGDTGVILLV